MRTCLIQLDSSLDAPHDVRVKRAADLVRAQHGADLVLLPELWAHGAFGSALWPESAEPLDGPTVTALQDAARDIGAYVHMGSMAERRSDGAMHNTAVLLAPDGTVTATYRKIHLFGFAEGEAALITRGTEVVTLGTWFGRLGLATCYDLRFPELFRAMVDRGVDVVSLVSGWPAPRIEHWRILARARAVENQAYVLACNGVGAHCGATLGGHSMVVDPWGEVLAEASGDAEEVLAVDVDVASVAATRERFPVLRDRVL